MYHVDPDVLSFMVAVFMACVTAFVSVSKKVMERLEVDEPYPKIWLYNEIASCFLAFLIALEIYPHLQPMLPAWITKPVFIAICVHASSRLIIMLKDKIFNTMEKTE